MKTLLLLVAFIATSILPTSTKDLLLKSEWTYYPKTNEVQCDYNNVTIQEKKAIIDLSKRLYSKTDLQYMRTQSNGGLDYITIIQTKNKESIPPMLSKKAIIKKGDVLIFQTFTGPYAASQGSVRVINTKTKMVYTYKNDDVWSTIIAKKIEI